MRLTALDHRQIIEVTTAVAGPGTSVRLFGSRVDDHRRGGDIDLMVTLPQAVEHPARLAAELAARIERALGGRKIDIVLQAPNLSLQPVHLAALAEGVLL